MKTTKRIFQIIAILAMCAAIYFGWCSHHYPKYLFGRSIIGFPEIEICLLIFSVCTLIEGYCNHRLNERKLAKKDAEIASLKSSNASWQGTSDHYKQRAENAEKKCVELSEKIRNANGEYARHGNDLLVAREEIDKMKREKDYTYTLWEPIALYMFENSEYFTLKDGQTTSERVVQILEGYVAGERLTKLCIADKANRSSPNKSLKSKKKPSTRKKQRV